MCVRNTAAEARNGSLALFLSLSLSLLRSANMAARLTRDSG